ncbi:MAG: RsmE family RNA methyltransferase, partial [Verrucomicrobiota bacterium]
MNIILLDDSRNIQLFDKDSRVYSHVRDVLRMQSGDVFDIGLINGPRGKAEIQAIDDYSLKVEINWGEVPERERNVTFLLGLARPQTVQKQLNVLATLGVSRMIFFPTERGEASYASSRVWRDGKWERHVLEGVEQAFATRLPNVELLDSLEDATCCLDGDVRNRCVLDNYEAESSLRAFKTRSDISATTAIAVGSERGWTAMEREQFRANGFVFAHMGQRVMRCETAAT